MGYVHLRSQCPRATTRQGLPAPKKIYLFTQTRRELYESQNSFVRSINRTKHTDSSAAPHQLKAASRGQHRHVVIHHSLSILERVRKRQHLTHHTRPHQARKYGRQDSSTGRPVDRLADFFGVTASEREGSGITAVIYCRKRTCATRTRVGNLVLPAEHHPTLTLTRKATQQQQ